MILSDKSILKLIDEKKRVIDPLEANAIQPASVDCSIGSHFLAVDEHHMDIMTLDTEIKYRSIESNEITLAPHTFILATTREYFELPDNFFISFETAFGSVGISRIPEIRIAAGFPSICVGTLNVILFCCNEIAPIPELKFPE